VLASAPQEIFDDPVFDMVVIATRYDSHADLASRALDAGKHVFVEKPLALTWEELDHVVKTYAGSRDLLLMVGFNRRFAPAAIRLGEELAGRRSPVIINYRLNAGYVPLESWLHGAEGGGRNLGEACHMYDFFRSFAKTEVTSVSATAIKPGDLPYRKDDNFAATVAYADGSVGNLLYTAMGPKQGLPKERIEVFCDGEAYIIDDFKILTRCSDGEVLWSGETDKGHAEEMRLLGLSLKEGLEAPIPINAIVETTAVSLRVQDMLMSKDLNE
jgi:predicted dehydrogenase